MCIPHWTDGLPLARFLSVRVAQTFFHQGLRQHARCSYEETRRIAPRGTPGTILCRTQQAQKLNQNSCFPVMPHARPDRSCCSDPVLPRKSAPGTWPQRFAPQPSVGLWLPPVSRLKPYGLLRSRAGRFWAATMWAVQDCFGGVAARAFVLVSLGTSVNLHRAEHNENCTAQSNGHEWQQRGAATTHLWRDRYM